MSEQLLKLAKKFEQEIEKKTFSPTFCVIPWMYFAIGPNEHNTRLCCYSLENSLKTESGQSYSFKTHTLYKIWNGKSMREIRRKMLAGEKLKSCQVCYDHESIGKLSARNQYNFEWLSSYKELILNKVKKSVENTYKTAPPDILEIRFGNFCNLKCRMCAPGSSSKIQKEAEELIEENKENSQYFDKRFLDSTKLSQDWYKDPKLLKNIYHWVPHLKTIHLTGGEPTLIKEVWELIDYIKENGYAKYMDLRININCTYVPEELLDAFNHFKQVHLYLSIDGYKETQEYIRYPSKWGVIEKNVKRILKRRNEKVDVFLLPTLQIYNIFNITELFQWADKFKPTIYIIYDHLILGHKMLNVDILPTNIKRICLDKILSYEKNCKYYKYLNGQTYSINENEKKKSIIFYNGLKSLKAFLKNPPSGSKCYLTDFRKYTEMLDKKRGNSFQKTFPEFYELLEQDGSWK